MLVASELIVFLQHGALANHRSFGDFVSLQIRKKISNYSTPFLVRDGFVVGGITSVNPGNHQITFGAGQESSFYTSDGSRMLQGWYCTATPSKSSLSGKSFAKRNI